MISEGAEGAELSLLLLLFDFWGTQPPKSSVLALLFNVFALL